MDESDFEALLSARLHARFDVAEPSEGLLRRVAEGRRVGSQPERRRVSVWMMVAALVVVVAGFLAISGLTRPAVAPPSPPPAASTNSPTATPSAAADRPFRVSIQTLPGSAGPTTTISVPADCNDMPSDWLRQICTLTLRPDWQSIIAPADPLGQLGPLPSGKTAAEVGTATWWAALVRANIDGDTTLCSDASARFWVTLGSGLGAAPEPGSTRAPLHPVAACLGSFRRNVSQGSVTIDDDAIPLSPSTVTFFVAPDASARLGRGSAPAFDPSFGCDYRSMTRETCNDLLAAILPVLGDRQRQVEGLSLRGGSFACTTSASPCLPPSGGAWLGNVVALTGQSTGFAFDVAEIGGQIEVTEVPYRP